MAKLNLHEIFFDLPTEERLAYIAHSRVLRRERNHREQSQHQRTSLPASYPLPTKTTLGRASSVPGSKGKLSAATRKAIKRRESQKVANTSTVVDSTTTKTVDRNLDKSSVHDRNETVVKQDKLVTKPDRRVIKLDRQAASTRVISTRAGGREVAGGRRKSPTSGPVLKVRGKENSAVKAQRLLANRLGTGSSKRTHTK